jgi:hypothetical protein
VAFLLEHHPGRASVFAPRQLDPNAAQVQGLG